VLGPDEAARRDPGHPLPHLCALVLCFRRLCLQVSGLYPVVTSRATDPAGFLRCLVTTAFNSLNMLVFRNIILQLPRKIKRKLRGSSVLQTRLKSLSSMDTAVLDEKEVIC